MANDKVDTRVVKMEFDNKQFEKNIKQTSKSLDNFKQSLDFKDAGDSLEKITVKFSALQVAATTFVVQLTNRLINLGTTLVKSLSVDNISSGWTKFGEKTISVATMMAQRIRIAGQEISDVAEKTRVVNEQLELLAWFSDETSYSFSDMTNNAGKFIAAGQDLDTSVKAMEGIATWAAKAGQNSSTASRAMYQLAQAMGKGKIQKIDWMSIQNANMDTEDFRETILKTAVDLGELTKEGDKFVTKTGKKFTQSQFADFLSEGWFTSDVLVKGLSKYSAAVDQIYEIANREGITASEVMEKYADQLDEFGVAAFKAAQEARTFSDVLNSVKDAVSSKWMTTFENIFGGQKEAVKLWTELANELYDVFAESGNFRNDILSVWKEMGGRDDIFGEHGDKNQGAFWNLYDAIIAVKDLISDAWNMIFPLSTMEKESDQVSDIARKLKSLTNNIKEFTNKLKMSEVVQARISKIFQTLFSIVRSGIIVLQTIRYIIDPIIELGKELVGQILDQILYSTNKLLKVGNKIESFAERVQSILIDIIDVIDLPGFLSEVFSLINDIFKEISNTNPLDNILKWINSFIDAFKEAGGTIDNFKKIFSAVFNLFSTVNDIIVSVVSTIVKNIIPVLNDIINVISTIAGFAGGVIVTAISTIADIINTMVDALDGLGQIGEGVTPILDSLSKIILKFVDIILLIPNALDKLSIHLTGKGIVDNLVDLFDNIEEAISNFINGVKNHSSGNRSFAGLFDAFLTFIDGIWEALKGLASILSAALTAIGSILKQIGLFMQYIGNIFSTIFREGVQGLTDGQKAVLIIIAILAVVAVIAVAIYNLYWLIKAVKKPISVLIDSITGVLDSMSMRIKAGIVESFANSILKVVVALGLLSAIDPGKLWASIVALAVVGGIFAGLIVVISLFNKQTPKAEKEFKTFKEGFLSLFNRQNKNEGLGQIILAIHEIGSLMLKVALAALIFDKVSWEGWGRAIATFGILLVGMGAFYVLVQKFGKLSEKITDKLDETNKSGNNFVKSLGAITVFMIGFKALAKAMAQFETISWSAIGRAIASFGAVIGILSSVVAGMMFASKLAGKTENISGIIMSLMGSIIGIALAISLLSVLDVGKMWSAVGVIAAILAALTLSVMMLTTDRVMVDDSGLTKTMTALKGIILSLASLAAVICLLSIADPGKVWSSVGALSIILAAIVMTVIMLTQKRNVLEQADLEKTMEALAGLVLSLSVLAGLLGLLSLANPGKVWSSVGALSIILAAIVMTVIMLTQKRNVLEQADLEKTMEALAGLVLSLSVLAGLLGLLSLANPGNVLASVLALTVILAALVVAVRTLVSTQKVLSDDKLNNTLKMLAGIIISMSVLTGALAALAMLKPESLLAAALALTAALTAIVASVILLNKFGGSNPAITLIGLGMGLTVMTAGMILFAQAARIMQSVGWQSIFLGLAAMAGGIAILGISTLVLKSAIPYIILLASAAMLAGLAVLTAGIGLQALATGLNAMNDNFTPALENLTGVISSVVTGIITGLINTIPQIIQAFILLLDSLVQLVPHVIESVGTMLNGILDLLDARGPRIIETVVDLFTKLITELDKNMKTISDGLMGIIKKILKSLSENAEEIGNSLIETIIGLLKALTKNAGPLIQELLNLLKEIVIALFTNIGPLIDTVTDYVFDFIAKVIVALTGKLVALAGLITKVVLIVLAAVIRLTIASLGALSKLFITFVAAILLILVHTFIGLSDTLLEVFKVMIKEALSVLVDAIIWAQDTFVAIGKMMLSLILRGIINTMLVVGGWLLDVIDTIFGTNLKDKLKAISDDLANEARSTVNNLSASTKQVENAIQHASNNINDVVSMTGKMANEAVTSGMGAISDTVTDSMDQLGDAMSQFGEEAGSNLYQGLGSSDNIEGAKQVGKDMASSNAEGFAEGAEINSPSKLFARFGNFLMQGLSLGIQNGASETEDAMAEVISNSLQLATDILDGQEGDDYTIKVGMDISSVEAQTSRIQDIMSGVNDPSITASGRNAGYNARTLERNNRSGETITDDHSTTVTYNNTFNIESTDPQQSADEIDKVLKEQNLRFKLAHGT